MYYHHEHGQQRYLMGLSTYITLEVVGLPSMDDIALVGQARPLVQIVLVVYVTDQGLALLGHEVLQENHWNQDNVHGEGRKRERERDAGKKHSFKES